MNIFLTMYSMLHNGISNLANYWAKNKLALGAIIL